MIRITGLQRYRDIGTHGQKDTVYRDTGIHKQRLLVVVVVVGGVVVVSARQSN